MKRILVALLWLAVLVGAGLLVWGVVYDVLFVNLPYQDAPPELDRRWRAEARAAERLRAAGGAVALGAAGLLMIVRRWQRRWKPRRG